MAGGHPFLWINVVKEGHRLIMGKTRSRETDTSGFPDAAQPYLFFSASLIDGSRGSRQAFHPGEEAYVPMPEPSEKALWVPVISIAQIAMRAWNILLAHVFFLIPKTHQRTTGMRLKISYTAGLSRSTAVRRITYIDHGGSAV